MVMTNSIRQKKIDLMQLIFGAKTAIPIVIGYIPISMAYGILAKSAGLSLWTLTAMSLLVYAGSSQFVAVGLIAAGANPISIISTTFLVNLRHLLMSASLAPKFKDFPKGILPFIAFGITDETFAINSVFLENNVGAPEYVLGLQISSQLSWIVGSIIGGILYSFLGSSSFLRLDFVLYAMFIFLLVVQLKNNRLLLVACTSGVLALFFFYILRGSHWYIIISTVLAATLGVLLEWKQR
jgi:4-azaleucine resistance transporter AzlC